MYKRLLSSALIIMLLLSAWSPISVQASDAISDIRGHWAEDDLSKWLEKGILLGYQDGTIKPDNNIIRAEFVTLINKVFGFYELSEEQFIDVENSKWYSGEILKARAAGYIAGYGNNVFKPENYITRQEAVVIIAKVFDMQSSNNYISKFKDGDLVKEYAKDSVGAMFEKGYITGYNDGTFRPDNYITRAETIKILNQIIPSIYNNKGDYGAEEINGSALINAGGVVLKNTAINGDLYLAQGIENGDVTLEGVDVKGTVYVNGGGSNSIHLINTKLGKVIVNKKGVRIVTSGNTSVESVVVKSGAKLEERELSGDGFIDVVVDSQLSASSEIEFVGDFGQVDVLAEDALLQTKEAKMRLKISGQRVKINGEKIEKSSKNYTVNGESISIETEEPKPSVTPDTESTPQPENTPKKPSNPGSSVTPSPTSNPNEEWQLVWRDEFDGTTINMDNWSYDDPTNGRWNKEIQSYTQNNAYIKDGSLIIEARKEDITEPSGETYNYSSSKLITKGKQSWKYGKFEIRAKMPTGQGIWPAIWMMPEDEPFYGTWPKCGEIDIMELLGHIPNKLHGTLHFGEPHKESQGTYFLPEGQSFGDDYHVYAIEWEPGEIRWYIDGELYHTVNDWYSRDQYLADDYTYPAPFDQNFFLIMNISVGGSWPGYPDETTVFPQQMAVDYVRVYQKNEYPHREKPVKEEETAREPLADGNYIYNGGFDVNDPEAIGIEDVPNTSYWTFLKGPGGIATVNVDEGVMHVQIEDGGTTDYSVQLLQAPVHLEKGAKYKASFDMKAQSSREIKLKIGGDGDRGWTDYAAIAPFTVSTEMESYEFEFTMKYDTDVKARFEFNMGLDDNDIWIDNVKLIKTEDAPVIDPSTIERPPLLSGNYIYNGTFDQGENRMGFWKFTVDDTAKASYYIGSDVNERRFETRIENGGNSKDAIRLVQPGINIEMSKSYKVSFEASAEKARTIDVEVASNLNNSSIYSATIELDKESKTYEFEFTMDKDSDKNGELRFNLGGNNADVYIDNVVMKKTSSDEVKGNLLLNGVFNSLLGWNYESYSPGSAEFENTEEQFKAIIASVGSEGWNVQLYQDNVPLEEGQTYEVSFDAKSTVDRKVIVQMQEKDVWTSYFFEEVQLTDELKRFKYEFTMDKPTDSASRFSFALGSPDSVTTYEPHEIIIDNVVVRKAVTDSLILNGTFDNDKEHWLEYWGGEWEDVPEGEGNGTAIGSCKVTEGELEVDITKVGIKDYTPQIKQENLALQEGETYTVSFKARALDPRSIKVDILDSTYNWYGGSTFDLTTEDDTYTFTFAANKSITDGVLTINLGTISDKTSAATTVYLDDILLVKQ
ncbi:MAG TPA: family 16 glycosylhydrolase [Clostridium sp.]|nr:family 16 glycosylhydrolase [Clostridium sp.]